MERSKGLQEFLDKFAKKQFGISQTKAKEEQVCVFCKGKIDLSDFRDILSVKEFEISGLCQKCQDETFGV